MNYWIVFKDDKELGRFFAEGLALFDFGNGCPILYAVRNNLLTDGVIASGTDLRWEQTKP